MNSYWHNISEILTHAFQPIVNAYSGQVVGYEVLLRNIEKAGFNSIHEVFDKAYDDKVLFKFDLRLREKAIEKFSQLIFCKRCKLFYNLDNRVISMPDFVPGKSKEILYKHNLSEDNLCYEISEKHDFGNYDLIRNVLNLYKIEGYCIALDDFGTGFSGLRYFHNFEPNYIKIDRFFISDIFKDNKKKIIVTNVVNTAKKLGIKIIAEGVENENEFFFCKNIGCEYIQGYLIQRPTGDNCELQREYEIISSLSNIDKRERNSDAGYIKENIKYIEPIEIDKSFVELFDRIRKVKDVNVIPVTNSEGTPKGVIFEKDLKSYVYFSYGMDLLMNKSSGRRITDFISTYPILDLNNKLEDFIEVLSNSDEDVDFIIVTENDVYKGLLDSRSLLKAANEKNLEFARNMNPLTKLPGNAMINNFMVNCNESNAVSYLIYCDFDNFKPFNDKYGFRRGDRAILFFTELMRVVFDNENSFLGHVGGDDFFIGVKNISCEYLYSLVRKLLDSFSNGIKDFYDLEDKSKGFIIAEDRFGVTRQFNFLSVSVALVEIPPFTKIDYKLLDNVLSELKCNAKSSHEKIAMSTYVQEINHPVSTNKITK